MQEESKRHHETTLPTSGILRWLAVFGRNSYASFLGRLATVYAHLSEPNNDKYDTSHLSQGIGQYVVGCVQDDEALLLFSVVRGMLMRDILEVGGLSGYSAKNFLRALPPVGAERVRGRVVTIDLNQVPKMGDNHITIQKPAGKVTEGDLRNTIPDLEVFDMVFFDAHHYDEQMALLEMLQRASLVNDDTILAFHDTNVKPRAIGITDITAKDETGKTGFVDCVDERQMVRALAKDYQIFQLHPPHNRCDGDVKFRHGITLLQKKQL